MHGDGILLNAAFMLDIVFTKDQIDGSEREFVEIVVVFFLQRENEEWCVTMGLKNELKIGLKSDWIVNLIQFKKK